LSKTCGDPNSTGQLIKWKDERGFGFIKPLDESHRCIGDSNSTSQEVFLHISELKDSTRRPQVGDIIYYHVVAKDGKIRACNAFILGAKNKPNAPSASNAVRRYPFPVLEVLLLSILPSIGSLLLLF
jgi:cold shock CspA family protein